VFLGPIAFKAQEDGVTVATHADEKVDKTSEAVWIYTNQSLSSMKKDRTIILKHGKIWKPS
jgi:hypothetical protein